ncbi:D-glycero-beta-D-manno-heptose-7-phosphate kinase [Marinibaculum pumilum]|uniref:Bifunctional protein HldE n=1 Tax=Marinibaculum pumilum TaxID=1766165 RepID=A0ABV7L8A5_9PROT
MTAAADPGAPPSPVEIARALARIGSVHVMVVGDVMLDRFVYGDVSRVSYEAPIPVLNVARESAMPGGAGNAARNAAALGARVSLVGVVGDDAAGTELREIVAGIAGLSDRLIVEAGRPTTRKTRFVAQGQQLLRTDRETRAELPDRVAEALLRTVVEGLADCQVMILSDYAKGVLGETVLRPLLDAAADAGVPVVVDPKSTDFARYRGAALIKPNRQEMAAACRMPCDSDAEVEAAARQLLAATGIGAFAVSRAEKGLSLVRRDGPPMHLQALAREVFDVSGAGDTLVAALALGLGAGLDPAVAAWLANMASGLVVEKVGTAVVHPDEILARAHEQEVLDTDSKVMPRATALQRIARWRGEGARIGFTNGCFDLVHPGHVSLLRQARAACDRLVVGLNTDASVQRLKGPERPVQPETARAIVLSSFAAVDMVVLFDEDTPIELIRAVRPDVLVKGADYRPEQVVGGSFVESYGGRVLLADLIDGQSTSSMIARAGHLRA